MNHSNDRLLGRLRRLETELHQPETRADRARADALLHPEFEEIGASGSRYDKAQALRSLSAADSRRRVHADDFAVREIAGGAALLTYRTERVDDDGTRGRHALRSSLWVETPSGWRLRFHQGTPDAAGPGIVRKAETDADQEAAGQAPEWDELAAGNGCFFDQPRPTSTPYWDAVATLDVSTLCLLRNQAYRGHCILIYDPRHAVRPDQLSRDEWLAFSADTHRATSAIMNVCKPDHINVECMGNQVPHLHWQIIPRYKDDPRWGAPAWTSTREAFQQRGLPQSDRAGLIDSLRGSLG